MTMIQSKETKRYINKSKSILDYIKKAENEYKQYWIELGLSELESELLIQLEIDEDMELCESKPYLSRSVKLECSMISLEDVKNDIEKYRKINKWIYEYVS